MNEKKNVQGAKHGRWGGGSKSTDSYRARKAWEKLWGKKVPAGYMIHHKDGNPENNSRANLGLITLEQHNKTEKKGKTLSEQERGSRAKENIGTTDGPQRRFRR